MGLSHVSLAACFVACSSAPLSENAGRAGDCTLISSGVACVRDADCAASETCSPVVNGNAVTTECVAQRAGAAAPGEPCLNDCECATGLCHESACTSTCALTCSGCAACRPVTYSSGDASGEVRACVFGAPWDRPILELGSVPVPDAGTGPISFEIPEGTAAFTLIAESSSGCIVPLRLSSPAGEDWFRRPSATDPGANLVRAAQASEALTMFVSDAYPAAPLPAGSWTVELDAISCTYEDPNYVDPSVLDRVAVILMDRPGGALDVNVHLTPRFAIQADDPEADEYFVGVMEQFWRLIEAGGLERGALAIFAADTELETLNDAREVDAACKVVSAASACGGPAIDVLGVRTLYGDAIGISPGVPGAPVTDGVPDSCIVLKPGVETSRTGTVMAHETFHFLGLRHTSESAGASCTDPNPYVVPECFDRIDDTDECAAPSETSAGCGDFTNLMYPINLPGLELPEVTEGQRAVLARSVVTR